MPNDIFGVSPADNAKLRTEINFGSACFVQSKQISFLAGVLISVDLVVIEVSIEHEELLAVETNFYQGLSVGRLREQTILSNFQNLVLSLLIEHLSSQINTF